MSRSKNRLTLVLAAGWIALAPMAWGDVVSDNRSVQEQKLAERIQKMKDDPESLFFARSDLPMADQQKIASFHLEEIQKLSQTEGFDYPDPDKIFEHAREILLKAPDTGIAQMAHWNIHTHFLMNEDRASAAAALESYLAKYPGDDFHAREAYDKLTVFAQDIDDWGLSLYYADKVLESDPGNYALLLTKARALIRLGEKAAGQALLERIIREAEGTVQYNLAMTDLDELTNRPPSPIRGEYLETMNTMRTIATAVETFSVEHMNPPGALSELVPDYLETALPADAWGRPFLYRVDPEKGSYWIASAGSDGNFLGFGQEGVYTDPEGSDIILSDGEFVFRPGFD